MSFSREVKEEIVARINSVSKADACLFGILLCTNILNNSEITLLTETKTAADFFILNTERICGERSVITEQQYRKSGQTMYRLSVTDEDKIKRLTEYFKITEDRECLKSNYPKKSLYPFMIGGMFLACGSLSDPKKGYHMEFSLPNLSLCNRLGLLLLEEYRLLAKNVERKNRQILYFKESENIIDMVTLMGATNSSLEFINVKIYKDMRNKINREVNCVNANIEKAIRAAERQIEDIELIDEKIGIGALPDNLREIAELRYNNPDYNLGELGAALDPPITRSGANHRLKKLAEIADELRTS